MVDPEERGAIRRGIKPNNRWANAYLKFEDEHPSKYSPRVMDD